MQGTANLHAQAEVLAAVNGGVTVERQQCGMRACVGVCVTSLFSLENVCSGGVLAVAAGRVADVQ